MSRASVRPSRFEQLVSGLRVKLEGEPSLVLDALVSGMARGQLDPEVWQVLHEAAARDERVADLAFAYERLIQDRKFKFLPTAIQCEVTMQAATFFADVFGDREGATNLLEQVLALVPSHLQAFAKLESLLTASGSGLRLADFYANAAMAKQDKGEQQALLWRAAEITDGFSAEQERAIKIYQSLLKIDPADERVRRTLEGRYRQAGRWKDVARLLEQILSASPEPSAADGLAIRERLISLFVGEIGEPERALPYVEEILRADPSHELARRTAHRLLGHKLLAARAAGALNEVYERLGTFPEAAAMLGVQLEHVRGPKKAEVQKRLAILKQDRLDDLSGAFTLFEGVVALDPGDDDARRRYRELGQRLGRQQDVARLLARTATGTRDAVIKAKLGTELGEAYLDAGDAKRARAAFATVIEGGTKDPAVLAAARALSKLYGGAGEKKQLAEILELLSQAEPDEDVRTAVTEQLARLAEAELLDKPRAIKAWRALVGSRLDGQALDALERLYEATSAYPELIEVIERRAERAVDGGAARALAMRAAELSTVHLPDRGRAIAAWFGIIAQFGPDREVNARLMPLLEQERKWEALASILEQEVALAPERERIGLLGKLAQVRIGRLHDTAAGIEAYRQIWALDPREPATRQALDKLLGSPEGRLAAAELLEPVYRAEGASVQLVKVLEVRAEAAREPGERLAALAEAATIAERDLRDPERALDLAGQALALAIETNLDSAPQHLAEVERLADSTADVVRLGAILTAALGDRLVDDPILSDVARRAGEALVSAGDPGAALALYRRALAFEPSSSDLLGRIDALLQDEGRPEERVVLYRAALTQSSDAERRRELLHAIAAIERRDLGDVRAAIETWRFALYEDPSDRVARAALLDAYESAEDWPALYDELSRTLSETSGDERPALVMKLGDVAARQGDSARALAHYAELLGEGHASEELLSAAESLADASSDLATLQAVLVKRIANAVDAGDECSWLTRLGEVQVERLGYVELGTACWRKAADLALQALGDEERARGLYERVLAAAPRDREAAERLARLYVKAELYDSLAVPYRVLVETATSDAEATRRLLELEPHAKKGAAVSAFLALAEGVIARGGGGADLSFARARVLLCDPLRQEEAATEFRRLIGTSTEVVGAAIAAFEAFLASVPLSPDRLSDRRFVLAYRAEHGPDAERVSALLSWGAAEQNLLLDPDAALAVYRRVLAIEPEHPVALEATARLMLASGDVNGALALLTSLGDHGEGEARRERDLQIAALLGSLDRHEDAVLRVAPLLDASPTDAEALAVVYRALEHPAAQVRAAAILERAADAAEDEAHTLGILGILLATPNSAELTAARRRWFEKLLDHYDTNPEVGLETALRGLEQVPDDEALWGRAEKLARTLDRPQTVADAYHRVLERIGEPDLADRIGQRAVNYQEEWFEDPQAVISLLRRVLLVSPEAGWARDRLKLAYSATERWGDLFDLYDDAIARAPDDAARAELLAEAAQAAKDFASDADRAIGYFERLLQLRRGDRWVASLLERLYEKQGRTDSLIDLLTAQLEWLDGDDAQRMRARIARLLLLERRDDAGAFRLVEEMLARESLRPEAHELLEALVFAPPPRLPSNETGWTASSESESPSLPPSLPPDVTEVVDVPASLPPPSVAPPSVAPPSGAPPSGAPPSARARRKRRQPTVRERAAAILKARYSADDRIPDLARVLEIELELLPDGKERARRHHELLALRLEKLNDEPGAFEHAAALVSLDPRSPLNRALLSDLADRLGWYERLAEVLLGAAEACADAPLVAKLIAEAAAVYRDKAHRSDRAIELLGEVLALNPKDRSLALAVATDLDALLLSAGRHEDRSSVLERIAVLEPDPQVRRAALTELSRIALDASDPDRAIRAWRSYLEVEGDLEGLDGLALVLRAAARWPALIELLEQRATARVEDDARRRDRLEIARIYADELRAVDRAIESWARVRADFGPGEESFAPLSRLLEEQKRWDDLARLVTDEALGSAASIPSESADEWLGLLRKKAEAALPGIKDRALAVHMCRTLLDAGSAAFRTPLSDDITSERAQRWADATWWALDQLVRMDIEGGEHGAAVALLLEGSRLVFDIPRARQLRRQAAAIAVERLGNSALAVSIQRELLAEDACDAVADAIVPDLARLLGQLGSFPELVDLWEQQARRHADAGNQRVAADLWAKAGELSERRLSDVERALADYQKSASQGSQTALRELARLHTSRGEHGAAAEVLERVTLQAKLDTAAADVLALADAYMAAGDRQRATARLEQAASALTQPRPVRARLRELYRQDENWEKLANLLRLEAEDAEDRTTRLSLLNEAADIQLTRRGDPAAAIPLLEQARKLEPDDGAVTRGLTRALIRIGRLEEAGTILKAELERYGPRKPKERALVHFELARVSLQLGEPARALAELAVAAKIDPAHPEILHALGRLSFEEGQLDRAQRTFRALLLVLGRAEPGEAITISRAEVLLELSAIAEKENEPDRAKEFIDSALHAAIENELEAASFERALRERGQNDLLTKSLEGRLGGAPSARARAIILEQLAEAYEQTGQSDKMRAKMKRQADQALRELDLLEDKVAWGALEMVYQRLGDFVSQGIVLRKRIALARREGPTQSDKDAWYRLAKLNFRNPETHVEAAELLEQVLEVAPDLERAEDALRPALESAPGDERILRLYERVARRPGGERALGDALVRLVEVGAASIEQIREGVTLTRRFGDDRTAENILMRALEALPKEGPDLGWARSELAELFQSRGELLRAANLKEEAAEDAPLEQKRALLLDVAKLSREELNDLPRAARIYTILWEREPADREIWEPLFEVLRRLGDTTRLADLIGTTLPLIESTVERSRLRLEQITIMLHGTGTTERAAALLQELLEDDPGQVDAAILLSGILEKAGRRDELVSLLERQLESAKDRGEPGSIRSLSMRLGGLLEQSGRAAQALDVYYGVLDWEPGSKEPLSAIARLSEERGDPYEIADACERLLAVETGEEAARLSLRLFALRKEQGDDPGADRAIAGGFRACPTNAALLGHLIERYSRSGAFEDLASLLNEGFEKDRSNRALLPPLLEAHRHVEQYEPAIRAVSAALEETPKDSELYRERARLYEALGSRSLATADFERAYAEGGAPYLADLVEALEREASRTGPPQDRAIKLRLSDVLVRTGSPDAGRTHLVELLKRDAKDRESLRALAKLEEQEGHWDAASTTLRRLLPLEDGEALIDVALKLADACERAGRFSDARGGLERALKASPAHTGLRAKLRDVYESSGAHRELAQLVLEDAKKQGDVAGRYAHLLRAGALLLDPDGDPAQAILVLEEARSLRPEDDEGVLWLGRALSASGRASDAVAFFNDALAARKGKRTKQLAWMHREIARIRQKEGDLPAALESLTKAFDMDLHNGEVALELGKLALDGGDQDLAARAFRSVTFMKSVPSGSTDGATGSAKGLSYFFLGRMAHEKGDLRKARLLTQKAVVEDPTLECARALLDELKPG